MLEGRCGGAGTSLAGSDEERRAFFVRLPASGMAVNDSCPPADHDPDSSHRLPPAGLQPAVPSPLSFSQAARRQEPTVVAEHEYASRGRSARPADHRRRIGADAPWRTGEAPRPKPARWRPGGYSWPGRPAGTLERWAATSGSPSGATSPFRLRPRTAGGRSACIEGGTRTDGLAAAVQEALGGRTRFSRCHYLDGRPCSVRGASPGGRTPAAVHPRLALGRVPGRPGGTPEEPRRRRRGLQRQRRAGGRTR